MTRGLISVNVTRAIGQRAERARIALHDGTITHHQVAQLLADLDRLILSADKASSILTAVDQALDGRVHTPGRPT